MLALTLTAELVGVTDLLPLDTLEEPYFYTFKVQCTSCREIHPNWISISRHERNEMSGSKGEANFVWRCRSCKRESTATIKNGPHMYLQASPPKKHSVIDIDCRGLEITEFKADGEWTAKGIESSSKFAGIDLQEGEWFDYDEKTGEEVCIRDVEWQIKKI